MVNIGITTYNRKDFLEKCINSVIKNTIVPYKLFVYDDASNDGTKEMIINKYDTTEVLLISGLKRMGITNGFNTLWKVSERYNDNSYFCYLQDDVIISEIGWLDKLIKCYETQKLNSDYKIGLFSGHHAVEHPIEIQKDINGVKVFLKKSMRATNMIATYEFWHKIGYVPLNNPDGSVRGFPGPRNIDGSRGKGSKMDLYITGFQSKGVFVSGAAGKSCSWNLGTYCMIIPGLVKHIATSREDSTWGNLNKG